MWPAQSRAASNPLWTNETPERCIDFLVQYFVRAAVRAGLAVAGVRPRVGILSVPEDFGGGKTMNQALALLEAGKAAERALKLVQRALDEHEGEMPRADAAALVSSALQLNCAALEVERNALGIAAPKRG